MHPRMNEHISYANIKHTSSINHKLLKRLKPQFVLEPRVSHSSYLIWLGIILQLKYCFESIIKEVNKPSHHNKYIPEH